MSDKPQSYKQTVQKQKAQQVEKIWTTVASTNGLECIVKLREKLKAVEEKRSKTRHYMAQTESNFNGLKKNIREFIRTQNTGKKAKR